MTHASIMKQIFGKKAPVVVCQTADEQKKYLAALKKKLKDLKTILLEPHYRYSREVVPSTEVYFSIIYPEDYPSTYDSFIISFDERHTLCVRTNWLIPKYYAFTEIHQLETMVDRILAEATAQENKQIKAQKIKELTITAIKARIREIAIEDEFDFHSVIMSKKVRLYVRIANSSFLEIDIPFKQFQESLQRIRHCIRLAREIRDLNVVKNIRYNSQQWHRWSWTSYQKLKNSQSL